MSGTTQRLPSNLWWRCFAESLRRGKFIPPNNADLALICVKNLLTYDCVCPNGTVPDVTSFANTLPFYICQETYIQCVANNPDDAQAQATCKQNQQCGTRNATAEAIAQTSAAGGSSASATAASSGSGSATAASTSAAASETDNAAITNIHQLSTGAFAALLLAFFKLFL